MPNLPFGRKTGEVLKILIKERDLTRKQLSMDSTEFYVCSDTHLDKILSGKVEPSHHMLMRFLSVLNIEYDEFLYRMYGKDIRAFKNAFEKVWDLNHGEQYEEMETQIENLKSQDFCDMTIPHIAQAVFLAEGVVLYTLHKDFTKSKEHLNNALKLTTSKKIFDRKGYDYKYIANTTFSHNEYRILRAIANVLNHNEKQNYAIKITRALCTSLENNNADYTTRKALLPSIYFNLSNMLLDENKLHDALNIVKKGMRFCRDIKKLSILDLLYYNQGKAFYLLGNRNQAEEYFTKSYNLSIEFGNNNRALFTQKIVREKYNIDIK